MFTDYTFAVSWERGGQCEAFAAEFGEVPFGGTFPVNWGRPFGGSPGKGCQVVVCD